MPPLPIQIAVPFFLAIAAYLAAGALSLTYPRNSNEGVLAGAKRTAAVGNVLLLGVFLFRWWRWGLVPLTGLGDSLNLFLIFCTGIILTVQRDAAMKPLLVVYLPALALLALTNAFVGPSGLGVTPRALNGVSLAIHVGLVFFAFALFFVASLTSAVYAAKAQHLKRHRTTGFLHRVPSLEKLDAVLYRLISIGYPAFVATLLFGFGWAWAQRDLLGPYWFVSSKVVLAFAMAVFFASIFHVRQFGRLRGPKLAYLVFFGFAFLLITYLAFGVMRASDYSFWGHAA